MLEPRGFKKYSESAKLEPAYIIEKNTAQETQTVTPSFRSIHKPRFALYPPLFMGLVHPEWLCLYQWLSEMRGEQLRQKQSQPPSTMVKSPIHIRFHPRRELPYH
ncbi:hypothetical protein C8J48_0739 [Desmospora activa DSM 45169]|uniref:Uncharacterized protein n=1 Tax=Desmospora activa DSM 45169 TaxID=1121389 RepID=A0A2T4Z8D6_9BACL|nr:hypothetical protein C8J48_0739 [Desmospora activa DSM 45169]